jgi:hypothetical protein
MHRGANGGALYCQALLRARPAIFGQLGGGLVREGAQEGSRWAAITLMAEDTQAAPQDGHPLLLQTNRRCESLNPSRRSTPLAPASKKSELAGADG